MKLQTLENNKNNKKDNKDNKDNKKKGTLQIPSSTSPRHSYGNPDVNLIFNNTTSSLKLDFCQI